MIMSMMENDPKVTIAKIREITGMSATKISLEIEHLKRKGMIERVGGTRGEWMVHR
jgi:predicted HTH transcriptional regulator